MKHILEFNEFIDESQLNEGLIDDRIVKRAEKHKMSLDDSASLEAVVGRSIKLKKELSRGVTTGKIDSIDDWDDKRCSVEIWWKDKNRGSGRSGGRSSMYINAKDFLKDYLPPKYKIKYTDPNVDIITEPTKKDIAKLKKFGKMDYEYYPGGYPSSATLKFDPDKMNRLRGVVSRITTREEAIRMAMACRSIYGNWSEATSEFKEKCADLDCTPGEKKAIEDYKVNNTETQRFRH